MIADSWHARGRLAVLALVLACASGCIASNVVEEADRRVVTAVADLQWQPASATDLEGLFESVEILGKAAGSLWKVYYLFEEDGRYCACALVVADEGREFQATSGTWRFTAEGLVLDGAEATAVERAEGHLRLRSPTDVVVLRRSELQ